MPPSRMTLVFPVETIARVQRKASARFLRPRAWLHVLIGGMAAIKKMVPYLPPSVFFGKSAQADNSGLFVRLHALGHEVVVPRELVPENLGPD